MFNPFFPVWLATLYFDMDFKNILLNHLNLWGQFTWNVNFVKRMLGCKFVHL